MPNEPDTLQSNGISDLFTNEMVSNTLRADVAVNTAISILTDGGTLESKEHSRKSEDKMSYVSSPIPVPSPYLGPGSGPGILEKANSISKIADNISTTVSMFGEANYFSGVAGRDEGRLPLPPQRNSLAKAEERGQYRDKGEDYQERGGTDYSSAAASGVPMTCDPSRAGKILLPFGPLSYGTEKVRYIL